MLVTPESNRRNRIHAAGVAAVVLVISIVAGLWFLPALLILAFCPLLYWLLRRRCLRRLAAMNRPFPPQWESILQTHVAFFESLNDAEKERFRQLVKVFLDEVRITGIRTEVDDTVRVLVAASAIIPVFGFHDWEYHQLGEVLIYPDSFGDKFEMKEEANRNILGMVGLEHLSGVMILSKPSLLAGFDNPSSQDNVGIHEFAHLVEQEESDHELPPEIPVSVVKQWVRYVASELSHPSGNRAYLNAYAYTNEHEFFAVMAEYFFKSPEILQKKDPQIYAMLRDMFHQDTSSLLRIRPLSRGRRRYGRNAPCPCGSGKKYKDCCLLNAGEPRANGV
jgi:Mlc titration factor MtfA (ptsG expression regulator)